MKSVKFGIVGCGHAAVYHAEAIRALPFLQLTSVCDPDPLVLDQFMRRYSVKGCSNYEKMLEDKALDVVIICTPSGTHANMGMMAANAGKHVLVEKPMALTLEDADKMMEACERNKIILSVVMQNRYKPPFQLLKTAVDKGHFGKLSHASITVRLNRDENYYRKSSWRGKKAEDGGVIMNQAIHSIDLLQWFLGPVESVFSYNATRYRPIESEDLGVAVLRFSNGALGVIEAASTIYVSNLEHSIGVFGEKGSVVIGGVKSETVQTWQFFDIQHEKAAAVALAKNTGPTGHQGILMDIADAVKKGSHPVVDGREGRKSLEIVLGTYRSAETGLPVSLPL